MNLSIPEIQDLFVALVNAFTVSRFDNMLFLTLGKNRSRIVADTDFDTIIRRVIETANDEGWERELIHGAIEANPGNEGLQAFIRKYPGYDPVKTPDKREIHAPRLIYAHILFISSAPVETTQDAEKPTSSKIAAPSEPAESSSQLFERIKAEAPRPQTGKAEELIFQSRDRGVVVTTFADPAVLLELAIRVAHTLISQNGGRLRLGLHTASFEAGSSGLRVSKVPAEGVEIARRVAELGSAGHILVTGEAADLIKVESKFEGILGANFDTLFHEPLKCELRPSLPSIIYNVYRKRSDADGHNVDFGNEARPRTKAPEQVIKDFFVPPVIRVMRKEQIKVNFCPEVGYFVKAQFKFKGIKPDNISITCENQGHLDGTCEYDFEEPTEGLERLIGIQVLNAAQDQNFSIGILCLDRHGKQINIPNYKTIKLRRSFWLWLWEVIRQLFLDKIWSLTWYIRIILALVILITLLSGVYLLLPTSFQERLKLYFLWPKPVVSQGVKEEFRKRDEDPRDPWEFTEEYKPVDGGGAPATDGALPLTGPRTLVLKRSFLKEESIYDFKIDLGLKFGPQSTRMGWIFRAQDDNESGYVFVLDKRSDNTLVLSAMSSYHGVLEPMDDTQKELEVSLGAYHDDDWVIIYAAVSGYRFGYDMQYLAARGSNRQDTEIQHIGVFEVKNGSRLRYGNVGIWVPNDSNMVVDFLRLHDVGFHKTSELSGPPGR